MSWRRIASSSVAGPSVATIFVLRIETMRVLRVPWSIGIARAGRGLDRIPPQRVGAEQPRVVSTAREDYILSCRRASLTALIELPPDRLPEPPPPPGDSTPHT